MFEKIINKIKNNKMTTISIIAIVFIPALYACNFVSAFADPYSNLSNVPVAIVNDDKSITYNNETVSIGETFVESIKESDKFKWTFVSEVEAEKGMKDNKYYFTVRIPKNFTSNIYSTLNGQVKEANLVYMPNDNNNYISGILGGVLAIELNSQLNSKVITEFLTTLGMSLERTDELSIGVTALMNGASDLNNGVSELSRGVEELNTNTTKLSYEATNLASGTSSLVNGYNGFNMSLNTTSKSLSSVTTGYNSLNIELNSYLDYLTATISSSDLSQSDKTNLIDSYKQMLVTNTALSNNLNSISSGVKTLSELSNNIYDNINKINTGTDTISSYLNKLSVGTNKLYYGSLNIYEGSKKLSEGITTLNTGIDILSNSISDLNLVSNANNLSQPVKISNEPYSSVENYGYGFAPYFISLGLFVGSLVTTIVLTVKKKKEKLEKMKYKNIFKRLSLFAVVVCSQAIILDIIMLITRIKIDNILGLILFSLLIGLAFMSIVQMLSTIFGDSGRFISVILLILQLTACGGTFPIETAPTLYNSLHNFMPMTYTVNGLRVIIGNGNNAILNNSILVLFIIMIVCHLATVIYFRKSKKFN